MGCACTKCRLPSLGLSWSSRLLCSSALPLLFPSQALLVSLLLGFIRSFVPLHMSNVCAYAKAIAGDLGYGSGSYNGHPCTFGDEWGLAFRRRHPELRITDAARHSTEARDWAFNRVSVTRYWETLALLTPAYSAKETFNMDWTSFNPEKLGKEVRTTRCLGGRTRGEGAHEGGA